MQLAGREGVDLTYCTNIHPGNGWEEVLANLRTYAPELRRRLAPDSHFGLGLRLSNLECEQLLEPGRLEAFAGFLAENHLYVALLNGFVHGGFHRQAVKQLAFVPDWQQEERVSYTLRLLEVLRGLLPAGIDGGISTSPLSYRPSLPPQGVGWEVIVRNLVRVAEAMVRLHREEGKLIHLDLEPEPDGLLEDSADLVAFFGEWLLPLGGRLLADRLGLSLEGAQELLLEHVRVCYDTCHFAMARDEAGAALDRFGALGMKVGRLQLSSALEVAFPAPGPERVRLARQLATFADSVYLHQVTEEGGGRYSDLPEALAAIGETGEAGWRVHFHVPLFMDSFGEVGSTQIETRRALRLLLERGFTPHLEIETYTWEVLPPEHRQDLLDSVEREYRWVLEQLEAAPVR